jgi:hypothetical protein
MEFLEQLVTLGQVAAYEKDVWKDTFLGLEQGQRFVVILVAIGCFTGIIITLGGIIAGVSNSLHRRRSEFDLKRDMLDRGMSAAEIAQVVESATPPEDGLGRWLATWGKQKK